MLPGYLMQPSDGARSVYPDMHWVAKELMSGCYPTWFFYNYGGVPFPVYGGGVIDLFIPLFCFLQPDAAATIMNLVQMMVLFAILFFWLRSFFFSELSSFLVAGLIVWSGPVMFWYGYGYPYSSYIYAVLAMILVERYYRLNNIWYLFFLSCTVALSATSMSIQHHLNVPIAILIVMVVWFIQTRRIRPLLLTLLFFVLGYGMASIHIIPLFYSLCTIGRGSCDYSNTFHFSPVKLFLAIWSGKEPTIQYPAIYFFLCPLLLVGTILFFIRKWRKTQECLFVITGFTVFLILIAPMYFVPLIVPAYRIADPYRQWFILLLVLAVACASAIDNVWKDIVDDKIRRPGKYWIGSIVVMSFFVLFKILETFRELSLLSIEASIGFFLFPVVVLPCLFFMRNIWLRSSIAIVLFGCSYYLIGDQVRSSYVKTLAQNPHGYRELQKGYDDLTKVLSTGAGFSVFNQRYWGGFDKVGPLEPAVSSLWGVRNIAGPVGFLFLPEQVRADYYKDQIIASSGKNFWEIVYPAMVCSDALTLAKYGVEILVVHENDECEFLYKNVSTTAVNLNNIEQGQVISNSVSWDFDSLETSRYYLLRIPDGYTGGGFLSCAELKFYDKDKKIQSSGIRVFANSELGEHISSNILDDNPETFWHVVSHDRQEMHYLLFDFGRHTTITRITALKRQSFNGQFWKNASIAAVPDEHITDEQENNLPFNGKIVPKGWAILPQIYGICDEDASYIMYQNKEFVGRAYCENNNGSLHGLPMLADTSQYVSIDVQGLPEGTRVVLADNYAKGWQVAVDGVSLQPETSGHFRSVTLLKDASVVEWTYYSRYFQIGVVISIFSLLVTVYFTVKAYNAANKLGVLAAKIDKK
jgi:hypothetical protein